MDDALSVIMMLILVYVVILIIGAVIHNINNFRIAMEFKKERKALDFSNSIEILNKIKERAENEPSHKSE